MGNINVQEVLRAGDAAAIKTWLAKGGDPNKYTDDEGNLPLCLAAGHGNATIVKLLVEGRAAINQPDKGGWSPLMKAAYLGKMDAVRVLMELRADVNLRGKDGESALNRAACWGNTEVVKYLIDQHAPLDLQDNRGRTALMEAAHHGHRDTVKLLLERKADPTLRSNIGESALDLAVKKNHEQLAKYMRQVLGEAEDPNQGKEDVKTIAKNLLHEREKEKERQLQIQQLEQERKTKDKGSSFESKNKREDSVSESDKSRTRGSRRNSFSANSRNTNPHNDLHIPGVNPNAFSMINNSHTIGSSNYTNNSNTIGANGSSRTVGANSNMALAAAAAAIAKAHRQSLLQAHAKDKSHAQERQPPPQPQPHNFDREHRDKEREAREKDRDAFFTSPGGSPSPSPPPTAHPKRASAIKLPNSQGVGFAPHNNYSNNNHSNNNHNNSNHSNNNHNHNNNNNHVGNSGVNHSLASSLSGSTSNLNFASNSGASIHHHVSGPAFTEPTSPQSAAALAARVKRIEWKVLKPSKTLGEGGLGSVQAGTWLGTPVAIKTLHSKPAAGKTENNNDNKNNNGLSAEEMMELTRDVAVLQMISHPNICLLLGLCTEPLALVSELLNTSLYKYLHVDKRQPDTSDIKRVAMAVARGLAFLHHQNPPIVHGQVRSANVLLDIDEESEEIASVKITDINLNNFRSKFSEIGDTKIGVPVWMAPEVINGETGPENTEDPWAFKLKADVYGFALILYELATHRYPFKQGITPLEFFRKVGSRGERPEIPSSVPSNVSRLIMKAWQQYPMDRPTMIEVIEEMEGW